MAILCVRLDFYNAIQDKPDFAQPTMNRAVVRKESGDNEVPGQVMPMC